MHKISVGVCKDAKIPRGFVLISLSSAFCRQSSWNSINALKKLAESLIVCWKYEDRLEFEWDSLDRCLSRVRHASQLFHELNLRAEIKRRTAKFEGSKRKKKKLNNGKRVQNETEWMKVMKKRAEFFFPSPPIRKNPPRFAIFERNHKED